MEEHDLRYLSEQIDLRVSRLERDLKPRLRRALSEETRGSLSDGDFSALHRDATGLLHEVHQLLTAKAVALEGPLQGRVDVEDLTTVVVLDIPEILHRGPMTLNEIAAATGTETTRISRPMTSLRDAGVFSYDPDTGFYEINSTSELLLKEE